MSRRQPSPAAPGFPPGLSQPALRALAAAGYTHLSDLARVTEHDLLQLHGVGPKAIRLLRPALSAHGLTFAASRPSNARPSR